MSINYDLEKVTPRPWNIFKESDLQEDHLFRKSGLPLLVPEAGSPSMPVEGLYIAKFLRADDAAHVEHCVNHHEEREEFMAELVMRLEEAACFSGVNREWQKSVRALLAKVKS